MKHINIQVSNVWHIKAMWQCWSILSNVAEEKQCTTYKRNAAYQSNVVEKKHCSNV
jgi:hypothetical protein